MGRRRKKSADEIVVPELAVCLEARDVETQPAERTDRTDLPRPAEAKKREERTKPPKRPEGAWKRGASHDGRVVQVAVRCGGVVTTCAGMYTAATNTWWALKLWPDCGWNPLTPGAEVVGWQELAIYP